jgi:hypothetical protein
MPDTALVFDGKNTIFRQGKPLLSSSQNSLIEQDDEADFLLDNSIRYGDDENKDEEGDKNHDPEYQQASTGEKRKHASTRLQAYKKRRSFPYDNAQAESSEPFILEESAQDPQEQASRASGTFGRGG